MWHCDVGIPIVTPNYRAVKVNRASSECIAIFLFLDLTTILLTN